MLKVNNLVSTIVEKIDVDPYKPIKIRWGSWNITEEPIVYWRTGDFKNSLVEIGIASNSGIIRSFTIVHSKDIFVDVNDKLFEWPKSYEKGTPVFNISKWPDVERLEEVGLLEIYFADGELCIKFSRRIISKRIISGRVCLGLDNDENICAFKVCELTREEEEQIKDTLNYITIQNLG